MRALWPPIRDYLGELHRTFTRGWDHFWFTPADPTTLAVIRIATGLVMLYVYAGTSADIVDLVGPSAWVDDRAFEQLRTGTAPGIPGDLPPSRWWWQSVWFYVRDPWWISFLHGCFLAAIVSFTLGLFARLSNLIVWIGHLSFLHRSLVTGYGFDAILAMLLFYLLLGPTGDALSLDQLRRVRRARRSGVVPLPPQPSWTSNAVVRMIQIHLCIVYLCSGLAKLQGESWWNGTAIWQVLMIPELASLDLRWLAVLPDWALALISETGVAVTLGFEISFAFLIWNRLLRPLYLLAAFVLHGCIGLFMGLGAFSAIMLAACLAFVPPESMRWFLEVVLPKRLPRFEVPPEEIPTEGARTV